MPYNFKEFSSILIDTKKFTPIQVWTKLCEKQLEEMEQQAAVSPFFASSNNTNRQIAKAFIADEKNDLDINFKETLTSLPVGSFADRLNLFLSCYPEYQNEVDEKFIAPSAALFPLPEFTADFENVIPTFKTLLANENIHDTFKDLYTIVFYMEMMIEKFDKQQLIEIFNEIIKLSTKIPKDRTLFNDLLRQIFYRLPLEDRSSLVRGMVPKLFLIPYDDCVTSLLQTLECSDNDDHFIISYIIEIISSGTYEQYEKALIMLMHIFKRVPASLIDAAISGICAHLYNQDINIRILVMRSLARIAKYIPETNGKKVITHVLDNLQDFKELGDSLNTLKMLVRFVPAESHSDLISILAVEMNNQDNIICCSAGNALLSLMEHAIYDRDRQSALEELMEFSLRDSSFVARLKIQLEATSVSIRDAIAIRLVDLLDNPNYKIDSLRQFNFYSIIVGPSMSNVVLTKIFSLLNDSDVNVVAESLNFLFSVYNKIHKLDQRRLDRKILTIVNLASEDEQQDMNILALRNTAIQMLSEISKSTKIYQDEQMHIMLGRSLYDDDLTIRLNTALTLCNIFPHLRAAMQIDVLSHLQIFIANPNMSLEVQANLIQTLLDLKHRIPYVYETQIISPILNKIVESALNNHIELSQRVNIVTIFSKLAINENTKIVASYLNAMLVLLRSEEMDLYSQAIFMLCHLHRHVSDQQIAMIVTSLEAKLAMAKNYSEISALSKVTQKFLIIIAAKYPQFATVIANRVVASMVDTDPNSNNGVLMKCQMLKLLGNIFNRLPNESQSFVCDAIIVEMEQPDWVVSITLTKVAKKIVKEISTDQRVIILNKVLQNLTFMNIQGSNLFAYVPLISNDEKINWDVKQFIFKTLLARMIEPEIRDQIKDVLTAFINNLPPAEKNYYVYGLMLQRVMDSKSDHCERYALIAALQQITHNARLQHGFGNELPRALVGIVADYIPLKLSYS